MNITLQAQQAVSEFLQVAQELVVEVREWANVLWVKVQGMRPRFVSKKVIKISKMLKKDATYNEAISHLKEAGLWGDTPEHSSVWGALQTWINSQPWKSTLMDELLKEINDALQAKGLPYGLGEYGVRKCWDSVVSFKLEANGFVFTFL